LPPGKAPILFKQFLRFRSICLIAVISLFAGAVLMFLAGRLRTIVAFVFFFAGFSPHLPEHLSESSLAQVALIQGADTFLFALVLLIFSYGITILFVETISTGELRQAPRLCRIRPYSKFFFINKNSEGDYSLGLRASHQPFTRDPRI
jgi:uncharacterized membrane protein YqhA